MQMRELFGRMSRGLSEIMAGAGLLLAAMMACGGGGGLPALGAPPEDAQELQDFRFATKLFQDSHYSLAETNFSEFLARHTNSPHLADAILYLARARLEQSNFNGAISLLQKSAADAGPLRPEYVFWIAKARSGAGDLGGAAEGFATVARDFPLSPRRLEASCDEAEIHARQGDWTGVIRLLQQTNGAFQAAASADGKSEFAALGWLSLGEAYLHEQRPDNGEKVLLGLDPAALNQDLLWRYQYLLCRLQWAGGRAAAALAASTNLLKMDLDAPRQAAGCFLQGEILETLGRTNEALGVYAKNLAESQPPEAQRQALARTIQLTVALNPPSQAIQLLDTLVGQRPPQAPGQDSARLSLGELYLKAFAGPPDAAASSNAPALLAGALTNLNMVISNYTNSPLLARARLDRGWCDWFSTNIPAAREDFEEAAARMPLSPDQAAARFKLADTLFILTNYSGAASNYGLVLSLYDKLPEVTNALFDLALYQIAEADIRRGDTDGARAAVEDILRRYPGSYYGDRGSLLMGQDLNRKGDYTHARAVFTGVLERSPRSPLLSKVQYAIARTYDLDGDWNTAISRYKEWEAAHAGDALLPEVEFHLALACGKAGRTNDALMGFTNFASRFPSNALAPWALNWVGDYYYNQGDWRAAEINYQELFQTYPAAGELAYQARYWAGKSALARPGTEEASDYFLKLVNLTNAPPALAARGYFALGDIAFQHFLTTPTISNLNQAIFNLNPLTNGAPTNAIAVEALGRLGDYYMAWPSPNTYAIARQMYETIVNFPAGSVSAAARCQAEVGLGLLAEKERNPELALKHYCNVVDNKYGPGSFDPYWVERAGEFAARVCEDQQHWQEAVKVYERVVEAVPAVRPLLEKKIAAAQARWEAAGK